MVCCGRTGKRSKLPDDPVEEGYKVGGRYKVAVPLDVFTSESLQTKQGRLQGKKDLVLLIHVSGKPGDCRGLVVPQPAHKNQAGWISLEDVKGKRPLDPTQLEGSWEMKARYCVENPSTVRTGQELETDYVAELPPGTEVLILDLGVVSSHETSGKPRLRALISAGDGDIIGWVSPETAAGDHLLSPVNLLSNKVVDVHRGSLKTSFSTRTLSQLGGPRKSWQKSDETPWEVGALYRMLEKVPVRKEAELNSPEVFKVTAGTLVNVGELRSMPCPTSGSCLVARVTLEDGPQKNSSGWVRCTAKSDGHDLMDTRDHREYDKIVEKLRTSVQSPKAGGLGPAELQAEVVLQRKLQEDQTAALTKVEDIQVQEARPEDTDQQDQKLSAEQKQLKEAFSEEERLRREVEERERATAAAKAERERSDMQQAPKELRDKFNMLDEFGQDDRPLIEARRELEDKGVWCGCACTK
eukprot:TRINITY_DN19499_c0_g1_i1.p1 TRINITY_DN19499_c0_g1~~TRINITY_DN19499_c0_g1_i1.p1  ORF type:complete len:499 (+),score=109.93 TRINITY_DN19499_c0_g1_i1:95-1498(+)